VNIKKVVITAAGRNQHLLPLQTLVDCDGVQKSALRIIIEESISAGIEDICIVICPGDQTAYKAAAGKVPGKLQFVEQTAPLGYGHALYCAKDFLAGEPFLHLVSDHLYLTRQEQRCAQQLTENARLQKCSISAVQATREAMLPYYGAIGGKTVSHEQRLYAVETVIEKPTPTEAEQRLIMPGLRTGHYLCFFGMHVLTPAIQRLLGGLLESWQQSGFAAVFGREPGPEDWLVPRRSDVAQPHTEGSMFKSFRRACVKLRIAPRSLQALRNTFEAERASGGR